MNDTDIADLARDLELQFGSQKLEDIRAKDAVLQMGWVDAQDKEVHPVGAGHDAMVYKQKFSYLSAIPYLRVNSPAPALDDHAEMLENALEGIMQLSQGATSVWRGSAKKAVWSGRGPMKVTCWPAAWSGVEFQQGTGEPETDYLERLELLKAQNVPIIWKEIDSENFWRTLDVRGNLDETVGIREMTARAVRKAYGDILQGQYGDRDRVRIIEYDDDVDCVTIVMDKGSTTVPREAKRWAHGMGVNPHVFIEMEPTLPPNDKGLLWAGCSFDGRWARPVIDSILSDALFNFRRATRAPDEFYLDKETTEGSTPESGASARKISIEPDGQMFFWVGEQHLRPQPAQTNEDGWRILSHLLASSKDMDWSEALKGAMADITGVAYNTVGNLAQQQFDPTIENFIYGANELGKRFFRSIEAFERDYKGIKGAPVEIPLVFTSQQKGTPFSLKVSAKDVKGWESRIQARLERVVPENPNGQITVARLATSPDNPLMDIPQAQSRYLKIENTQDTNRKILRDQFRRAMVEKAIAVVAEQGLRLMQGNGQGLASVIGAFDPAEQETLRRLAESQGTPLMPPDMANVARGAANTNRTGLPQQPTGARESDAQTY